MIKQNCADSCSSSPISIVLAEDNALYRKSLKKLIETYEDIKVIGETNNGIEAVNLAQSLKPQVIVMDIAMPLMNGLQATEKLKKLSPAIRILILSAHPDPEYIHQAITSGASGYLIKQSSTEFLAQAIREVLRGRTYFSISIPNCLRKECQLLFTKKEGLRKRVA